VRPLAKIATAEWQLDAAIRRSSERAGSVDHRTRELYPWAALGTVVFLCLPILSVTYFPLVDFPNHLARCWILSHYGAVAGYRSAYQLVLDPIPNLGVDLVLTALLSITPLLMAVKLFMVLLVVMYAAGCHLLFRAVHGEPAWIAIPAMCTVYSSMLLYGFVNYVFGLALFLIVFACWLEWRRDWTGWRVAAMVLLVTTAYLAHLSAYAFLGFAFLTVTAWRLARRHLRVGPALLGLAPLLPPLFLFFIFMTRTGRVGAVQWNTLGNKLAGLAPFFLSYRLGFDLLFCAVTIALLAAAWSARQGWHADRMVATVGGLFFIMYLATPLVLFTSSAADARWIPPGILLLAASLHIALERRTARLLFATYMLLSLVRVGLIWKDWIALDRATASATRVLDSLPQAARVYPAWFAPVDADHGTGRGRLAAASPMLPLYDQVVRERSDKADRSVKHAVFYAVIEKHAVVPTLFAHRGQQPLVWRGAPPPFQQPDAAHPERWLPLLKAYDFVWTYAAPPEVEQQLATLAVPVATSGASRLWNVHSAIADSPGEPSVVGSHLAKDRADPPRSRREPQQ